MDDERESTRALSAARPPAWLAPVAGGLRVASATRVLSAAWLLAWLVLVAGGLRAETGAGELRILMLGDSLTAGYGLASGDALPARLEAALRERGLDVRVIDAGVSGDTTAGGLARLEWALADRPHAVIVALGANDALRAIDPDVSHSNLDRLVARAHRAAPPVLLAGMLAPRNLGPDYGARFDAIYPRVADRYGTLLYPFLLDGVATVAALNQADGLHPNEAGVEVDRGTHPSRRAVPRAPNRPSGGRDRAGGGRGDGLPHRSLTSQSTWPARTAAASSLSRSQLAQPLPGARAMILPESGRPAGTR